MKRLEDLKEYARKRTGEFFKRGEDSVFDADCDIIEYALDNCEIFIKPEDAFFVGVETSGIYAEYMELRKAPYATMLQENGLSDGKKVRAFSGYYDFGHTSADWESVITLGIFGLRERIIEYRKQNTDESKDGFYKGCLRVYDAALRFMDRCADLADEQGKAQMSEGIRALTKRAPITLYEAMQCSLIYYALQRYFEQTALRTMGRIDRLFYPYYTKESHSGAKALCLDYLKALDALKAKANIPFALGGSDVEGKCLLNDLSYMLMDAYIESGFPNVKLHILCTDDMPEAFLKRAMSGVINGNNSIIFLSDKKITEGLMRLGERPADAVDYHVVGCYECGGRGELTCSCNAKVNIPKALEYAINDGIDMISGERVGFSASMPESFEELFAEFLRQLEHLCGCAMKSTDLWEEIYSRLHSAPILSATYESALEAGGDLYCENTAVYNNSSLNAIGLATAADSLYAIKKLVFDEESVSLSRLAEILRTDWRDEEALRLRCKNRIAKYGNGNAEVDKIAKEITDFLARTVSGKPNKKGGCYRLGLFSIDWRHELGSYTAASADGRRAGETLSQNTGASFGADKMGATACILSVTAIDAVNTPNGAVLDLDLHRSAVDGENGIKAMMATLNTFLSLGGFGIQYNVLDTEVLRLAKEHPEKYPSLQVRLCGWNVLFSTLSDKEKEEFILRSVR